LSEQRGAAVDAWDGPVPEVRAGRKANLTSVPGASTEDAHGEPVGACDGGIVLAVGARADRPPRPTFYPRGAGEVGGAARAA
jgi:hypothetical protein